MARVLITGARGFIGRHLARRLAGTGHEVCGVGHGVWAPTEAAAWGVTEWVNGDIVPSSLRLLQGRVGAIDHVVHLAGGSAVGPAVANPREDFFRTVATTAELLDWMRVDAAGARLLAVSSAAVYGAGHHGPVDEDAPLSPYSPYGYHKRLMEELAWSYAESYGLHVTVARLFSVYGAGLKKQLLWDACTRLASTAGPLELGGTGDELRDWTDVRDVVRALETLIDASHPSQSVFNVGTGVGTPVRHVAGVLTRAWAGTDTPREVRFSGRSRPGDPFSLVADPARIHVAGVTCSIGLEPGLQDYVTWFRSRPGGVG
jgi:UDP-glucose 4-epimerase